MRGTMAKRARQNHDGAGRTSPRRLDGRSQEHPTGEVASAQEVKTCRKLLEADERELRIVGKAPYTEVIKANRSRSERGRRVGLCLAGWPVVVP